MKNIKSITIFLLFVTTILNACNTDDISKQTNADETIPNEKKAEIVSVTTSGAENNYIFNVGISSPDKGCEQYADWWEVITEEGILIYRRILAHSHVNEQPFTRSGSGITISPDQQVWVRLHMNNTGYSTQVMKGSVSEGFVKAELPVTFASNLETEEPLPSGCAF